MPRIVYHQETTSILLLTIILYMYLFTSLGQNKSKVVTDKQSGVLADEQKDRWMG